MSFNYTLKYRTFDQLLSDVHVDFQNMSLESMIEPQQLIKVVKRVNYDLGLRINKTKETLLEVSKGRVKLPDDFYVLNYALVCDEVSVTQGMPQGTWIEERPLITPYKMTTPGVISTCNDGTVNCCGTCSQQFGNCGCAVPTCSQCTQPTSSCGCSTPSAIQCTSCATGSTTVPCSCNILEKLPDPCPKTSTTTNSTTSSSVKTSACCWTDVLLFQSTVLSIMIDGTEVFIPIGTASVMQAYLNGLGVGTWTVTDLLSSRFTFCVTGTNDYGVMNARSNNIDRFIDPSCSSDTVIVVTNTSIETCACGPDCDVVSETQSSTATVVSSVSKCCWRFGVPDGTIEVSITINGTVYIFKILDPTAMQNYLNTLGLGTFTVTALGIIYDICVTGTANYGPVTVTGQAGPTIINPTCTVDNTSTTVITTVQTCKCKPKAIPTPIPPPVTCVTTTDPCVKPRVILNCKDECFELVQIVNPGITRTYKRLSPITILENPQMVDCGCPNLYWKAPYTAWIRDGWLYTSLDCAVIYISYQGQMEDDDGNLLCPDHDEINEYYEYAVKQRILENLIMNDEPVGQKMALVEARLRAARNYALTIVNTPNFSEMKQVWAANRKAMYGKYYNMFKSYGPIPAIVPTNNFINGYNK